MSHSKEVNPLEDDEVDRAGVELLLEEVVTMIMDGKIADAKTQLAILKTWALLQIQGKK